MASTQPHTTPAPSNGLPEEVITCLQNARFVSAFLSSLLRYFPGASARAIRPLRPLHEPRLLHTMARKV
jgi:hypothetical protein